MDFGIARAVADSRRPMTATAQVIGTAQYLSPEQARGEKVDARSDVYSIGCLLYELLTGPPPFTGDSPVALAYQHVRENPAPPSQLDPELPPSADAIVLQAMAKDPNDRYQSAADMRSDIQRALSGFPVAAAMPMTQSYAGPGPGTRRMDPMGQTQLQGATGAMPPYQYGPEATGMQDGPRRRKIWPWIAALLVLAVIAAAVVAYEVVNGTGGSVAVPANLVGMKFTKAEAAVTKVGLTPVPKAHKAPKGPYNIVTSVSPASGTKEAKGSSVTLNYNVPPSAKIVPSVAGLSVSAATAKLKAAGFKNVTAGSPVANLKYGQGDVIKTNPAAGTQASLNTQIVLTVSGGGTAVPQLFGLAENDAIAKLNGVGLAAHPVITPGPPGTPPGTVWKTVPGHGHAVLPTGSVTIYVEPGSSSTSPPTSPPPTSPPVSPSPSPSSSPSATL